MIEADTFKLKLELMIHAAVKLIVGHSSDDLFALIRNHDMALDT